MEQARVPVVPTTWLATYGSGCLIGTRAITIAFHRLRIHWDQPQGCTKLCEEGLGIHRGVIRGQQTEEPFPPAVKETPLDSAAPGDSKVIGKSSYLFIRSNKVVYLSQPNGRVEPSAEGASLDKPSSAPVV